MEKIDLSGVWQVTLDPGMDMPCPAESTDTIILPGTTSGAGIGPENTERDVWHLTDAHSFEGRVWYSRDITVGEIQPDASVMLTLERTRMTEVFLDGKSIGTQNSLTTPHRYLLPGLTSGLHRLTVGVTNTGYPTRGGHLTSPDTQSNWNGITGEISLTIARTLITGICVRTADDLRSIHVRADVSGPAEGTVTVCVPGCDAVAWPCTGHTIEGDYPVPETLRRWDELSPVLHTLCLTVGEDSYETTFGLRCFHADGRRLRNNGREVFLRGKHDGLIFPRTGCAPTGLSDWMVFMETVRSYGLNHIRYHTCCPPDAAFTAADRLGIFMEPELPFWGTVTEPGEEGYDREERAYLTEEGFRILREYGHHPSFVMLSMGNELWGSKDALNRMLAGYRAFDPDKLYVSGSNNWQFMPDVLDEEDVFVGVRFSRDRLIRGSYAMCDAPQGIVQTTEPESVRNYDGMIDPGDPSEAAVGGKMLIQYGTGVKEVSGQSDGELIPDVPVIAHEVGQYAFYPDFDEIGKYTGPLKPRNLEVFAERLRAAGRYDDHARYFRSAGRLAVDCYRRELETFLRSRELSGFQLLDLQDFSGQGTALVGVLNAFMESKGFLTPEEWRRFCAGTVVLGEFDRFVLQAGDPVRFGVRVSECDPKKKHDRVTCTLLRDGELLNVREIPLPARNGRLTDRTEVDLGCTPADAVARLTVRLSLPDGTRNEYALWSFSACEVSITREGIRSGSRAVRFVRTPAEARQAELPAIIVPDSAEKLPAEYCTDFWNYPMFRSISESMHKPVPVGTLGLCIRPEDPLLSGFPADDYTTPPWYRILAHAHCEPIGNDAETVVEMIDNTERCGRLGILYKQDGCLCLTARLWEDADSPEVRVFAMSLLNALCPANKPR